VLKSLKLLYSIMNLNTRSLPWWANKLCEEGDRGGMALDKLVICRVNNQTRVKKAPLNVYFTKAIMPTGSCSPISHSVRHDWQSIIIAVASPCRCCRSTGPSRTAAANRLLCDDPAGPPVALETSHRPVLIPRRFSFSYFWRNLASSNF
jgi:hypothetical protein